MPLIPFADIDRLNDEAKTAFDRLPVKLNIMRMLANAETCFAPFLRFGGSLLVKAQLDSALREIIILQVVHIEGGEYEWVQHVPIALGCGVTQAQIDAIAAGKYDAECFSVGERAVMNLAAEVVEKVRASEETLRKASEFLSPREIVELILTIGNYMMVARLTETTRVEIDGPAGTKILDAMRRQP